MYCRNCGNEVHDKAVACPKCGVNPRLEKKFCPSCRAETNANQVMCTNCGVSFSSSAFPFDTSSFQKIDYNAFIKNKSLLFASIAIIGCFMPWIKINAYMMTQSINCFGLSKVVDYAPNTILVSFILYLFPLSLLGFILADFVPQLNRYKKLFSIGSLMIVVYAAVGLYLASHPSVPKLEESTNAINNMMGQMMASAQQMARDMISIGFGFYVSLGATIASFIFAKKQ